MENKNINEIYSLAMNEIQQSEDTSKLQELKIKFLAKKSVLSSLMSELANLPPEERKEFGKNLNDVRNRISEELAKKKPNFVKTNLIKNLKVKLSISLFLVEK